MKSCLVIFLLLTAAVPAVSAARSAPLAPADQSASSSAAAAVLPLRSKVLAPLGSGAQSRALRIDGLFIETPQGRTSLPGALIAKPQQNGAVEGQATMPDGRVVKLSVVPDGNKKSHVTWDVDVDDDMTDLLHQMYQQSLVSLKEHLHG